MSHRSSPSMRRPLRSKLAFVVSGLLVFALSGCISSGSGDKNTIRYPLAADPTSFNPAASRALDDYSVNRLLYDTVLRRDEDGSVVGGLAKDWQLGTGGGTFHLRDNATCADGTPITAQVAADSLTWMSAPDTRSPFRAQIFGPKNKATFTAVDKHTLRIDLERPFADLEYGLTHISTGIVCPAGLKDVKGMAAGTVPGAYSGPYTLQSRDFGVSYEFALRKDYQAWPQFKKPLTGVPPTRIITSINANASTISNELLAGGLDIAQVRGLDMTRFESNPSFDFHRIPSASAFIQFNERPGMVFADEAKRRAVAQIVNRVSFDKAVTGGVGKPFTSVAQPSVPCANTTPDYLIKPDEAAAKKTLKGVRVRVLGSLAVGPNGSASTYLAEALRAAGVSVDLRLVDNGTWLSDIGTKPETWDVLVMASINGAGTMNGAMSTFVGVPSEDGGMNSGGKPNQPVLDLMNKAMATSDQQERCSIINQAEKILYHDADVIPMSGIVSQITARKGYTMRTPGGTKDEATFRIHQDEVK